MNPYESPRLVSEYLFFHYASFAETTGGLPVPENAWGFAQRVVRDLIDLKRPAFHALDIGCAVGASSFELARHVPSVLGIDYSHAFIDAAKSLKKNARLHGEVALEGRRMQSFVAEVPSDIDRNRVSFETGNATALRTDIGSYDVVLAANLLCRLPDPLAFLERLPDLVAPGGQLLLATPFSWLSEFTPESKWIGGSEESPSSLEALTEILAPHFTNELTINLPFLIREHSRKFQYGISLGTLWRRR
jgi:putative 4-mercaptohistidine N1-methyltranferase